MKNSESLSLPAHPYTRDEIYTDYDLSHHADIHNHCTPFSPDASQSIDEQIAWMRSLGFRNHILTDHYDKGHLDANGTISLERDCERYPKIEDEPARPSEWIFDVYQYFEVLQAKQKALAEGKDPFDLLIGIELGYLPEIKDDLNAMVERWPFDQVIGSAHSYDNQEIYAARSFYDLGKDASYTFYLERLDEIVRELDIDILGHFDYVTRYNLYKQPRFRYDEFPDQFDMLFNSMIDHGVSLEINTGTQVRTLGAPSPQRSYSLSEIDLPDPLLLKRYRELGGELISVGSDAHHFTQGGRLYKENLAYLESLGFEHVFYFRKRQPVAVPIR